MGDMQALALPRVSREAITEALRQETGLGWDQVVHVTATTTLARAIQDGGAPALPIATLLDLVTLPGLPGEMSLPLDDVPGSGSCWRRHRRRTGRGCASGSRRPPVGDYAPVSRSTTRSVASCGITRRTASVARCSHLVASTPLPSTGSSPPGSAPSNLVAHDPAGQLAARAWAQAEADVPALGAPRELLWVDLDDLADGLTAEARGLRQRIGSALDKAFGGGPRRTIVHHGFYFFSPVQWAFFQALARVPGVDQVFVVHDDGENPAFSTWRYFFRSEWQMPIPRPVEVAHDVTPAARAFRNVLAGAGAGIPAGVEVIECRSPAELVRLWREETEGDKTAPARFAAAAEQVERYVGRLGRHVARGEAADDELPTPTLSQLPVGSFLLALHGCITEDDAGAVSFTLTGDVLLDMVASGYLDVRDPASRVAAPLLRRVLPYFADCRTADDWTRRADLLVEAIEQRVEPHGGREPADDDATRIERAVHQPDPVGALGRHLPPRR